MVACFGKGHYHPLLKSEAHDGTMPHPTLSWYSNESWHCACDSSFVHKALCPCAWHPASCLELTSLLLYPHAASKQQTMTLCSWLFKPPRIRHCGLVPPLGGSPHPLCHYGYGVAHHHMSWSPCVGTKKACLMYLTCVEGVASMPLGVATPMSPCLTLSHLASPHKEHFKSF